MAKPCVVFWDTQSGPRGQSVGSIINLIRSAIIKPHNLHETRFYFVCDQALPSNICQLFKDMDVDLLQATSNIIILNLMRNFVRFCVQDCTIILLSGDANYCDTLSNLKKRQNVSIHLIRSAAPCSPKLEQISDYTYMLDNGVLKLIKSTRAPKCFISIKNYPVKMKIEQVMNKLNSQVVGKIENCAILYDDTIFIGFPTLWHAERAVEHLNGLGFCGFFLNVELTVDSLLTKILKRVKPNKTTETKSDNEVKQLTFIKMSNSNEADNSKIIKFCTAKLGSQCILSRKPYLWIVFSYKSDAQKVLPKLKIIYPDAVISKPPIDLTLKCANNSYILEPPIDLASNRTENELLLKAAIDAAQVLTNERLRSSFFSLDVRDDNDWKIFFRYNSDFIAPMLNYKPNKWSRLYTLFEQIYDLGAKKVVFDGNLYCAQFDSASAYQDAYAKIPSRNFRPLEFVNAQDLDGKFKKKLNRYIPDIPWCLNEDLDIHCFVVKIGSPLHDEFIEMSKNILGNRECIFIKSIPGEIWIGFPDEISRENSEKTVERFVGYCTKINDVSIAKPSNELLESINFRDLAGDAYDLAFLSSQLEDSKPITRPHIIERIRIERMREQESNDSVFQVNVRGEFRYDYCSSEKVLDKVVKILVYFSKVIPLAVTASDDQVNLMYKTWYEANVARHFINNLREDEVPYLSRFYRAPFNVTESFTCSDIYYYIINDQRKVLEKIVQNKSLVNQSDANSSTVQSTLDIDALNEEIKMKLQHLFVITTDSDFKFTSGMITIIKMNLVKKRSLFYFGPQDKMKYPVYIEFEDKIWVGFDDYENGKKAKARIEEIKFKILHEHEGDFEVGVVMEPIIKSLPPKVTKMLANKLMDPETRPTTLYMGFHYNAFPLGHFNYSYRKELGMKPSLLFD